MSFQTGDRVRRTADGVTGVVAGYSRHLGYQVIFSTGAEYLDVSAIEALPPDPENALLNGDLSQAQLYGLRIQALYLKHAYRYDDLAGLSNARIEPAFHQVMVALRVLSKSRPRMILADEVGLGKTIEAGLILKELRARQMVERVLIVVPASLQWQWQQELHSKFNEQFEVLDGAMLRSLSKRDGNPWRRYGNVICSLSLARREAHTERIIEAGWDLVIFDEAHKVRRNRHGKRVSATLGYQLADGLKGTVHGMLLLTATPMQLHPYELYSLIELVEPGIYSSFEHYAENRHQLPKLAEMARDIQQWDILNSDRQQQIEQNLQSQDLNLHTPRGRNLALEALDRQHPFTRAMIRNRKVDVGGFTKRQPRIVPVRLDDEEMSVYEAISDYLRNQYKIAQETQQTTIGFLMVTYQKMLASSSSAVRSALQRRIVRLTEKRGQKERQVNTTDGASELWTEPRELSTTVEHADHRLLSTDDDDTDIELQILRSLTSRLGKIRDSKAQELVRTLKKDVLSTDKVIIFTQFLETQRFLAETLRFHGYDVELFNGQMDQHQKDLAVVRFRSRSQILIATEAGGEGRNFQFAHIMVNYDLPWNPMKVEQRIGRLDRMGQKKEVVIYNFACKGTIEERVLDVLHRRIRLFEESVGSLDPILGAVEDGITNLAFGATSDSRQEHDAMGMDLEQRVQRARMLEHEKQYFALDPATFRRDQANSLIEKRAMASPSDLQRYVEGCLRYFGGRLIDHPDGGVGIYLSQDLQQRLRVAERSYRGVFDYREALAREDLEFLAFGQHLVDSIVDLPVKSRSAVACHRRVPDLLGGTYVEVFYAIEAEGPVRLGQFVHHLVDEAMNIHEQSVNEMPAIGERANLSGSPDWAASAIEASKVKLASRRAEAQVTVERRYREWCKEELDRTARIYRDRERRLRQMIDDDAARIETWTTSEDPRERRILPAIQGRLRSNREKLSRLNEDRYRQISAVRENRPSVSVRVLATALVEGY